VLAAVLLAVFASLAHRRRRLAVLRALGASRWYIFAAVWLHVTLLIGLGAGGGLLLGWVAAAAVSAMFHAQTSVTLPVSVELRDLGDVALLVAAGAVVAAIPAWLGYRLPVAASLRDD